MEILDAHKGKAHITPQMVSEQNMGVFGPDFYVFDVGEKLRAELLSNNQIRIHDGVFMYQGIRGCVKAGTYDDVMIENGRVGTDRKDIVAIRYTKNQDTKIADYELVVIKGTENTDPGHVDPERPVLVNGDIRGGDLVAEVALYELFISGITVSSVKCCFDVYTSLEKVKKEVSELSSTLNMQRKGISWKNDLGISEDRINYVLHNKEIAQIQIAISLEPTVLPNNGLVIGVLPVYQPQSIGTIVVPVQIQIGIDRIVTTLDIRTNGEIVIWTKNVTKAYANFSIPLI